MSKRYKYEKTEIRINSGGIFYCNYCGDMIDKTIPVIVLQKLDTHSGTAETILLHTKCSGVYK